VLRKLCAVLCVVSMNGCYHAVVRGGPRVTMEAETRTAYNTFWGLGSADFDLADCPSGVSKVEVWYPWWGVFPELLTLGFVSPKKISYICAQNGTPANYPPPPAPPQG
jgi:hypothetical protein